MCCSSERVGRSSSVVSARAPSRDVRRRANTPPTLVPCRYIFELFTSVLDRERRGRLTRETSVVGCADLDSQEVFDSWEDISAFQTNTKRAVMLKHSTPSYAEVEVWLAEYGQRAWLARPNAGRLAVLDRLRGTLRAARRGRQTGRQGVRPRPRPRQARWTPAQPQAAASRSPRDRRARDRPRGRGGRARVREARGRRTPPAQARRLRPAPMPTDHDVHSPSPSVDATPSVSPSFASAISASRSTRLITTTATGKCSAVSSTCSVCTYLPM